jgi:hypothetical protein
VLDYSDLAFLRARQIVWTRIWVALFHGAGRRGPGPLGREKRVCTWSTASAWNCTKLHLLHALSTPLLLKAVILYHPRFTCKWFCLFTRGLLRL